MEIQGVTGTAATTDPLRPSRRSPRPSSAGSRAASAKCGTRPSAGQPVRSATKRMPLSNRAGSPRKRLTMKPRIIAASASSSTALVPTRLAMTPPRSMSPTSTTGTSAARAKPILAMSPALRFTSDAEPAPSTRTRSASSDSREKLSRTASMRRGFQDWYSRAFAVPTTRPCTTTCEPISLWGFSSTGFMWTLGATPAAARLQRLGAADLAAIRRDGGIVRHVLRLEGPDLQTLAREDPAQARHQKRLAHIGAGALDHQSAHQNSTPSCAFTPAAKWCLTRVISVTRSAASISSGFALRPVTTTWRPGLRWRRVSTTSARSRYS